MVKKFAHPVEHPDNLLCVGWTSIWGCFTPEDMEWLQSNCHKGYFTPTFYSPKYGISNWTPEKLRQLLAEENLSGLNYRMFYFSFPIDKNGVELLRSLNFNPESCRWWQLSEYFKQL